MPTDATAPPSTPARGRALRAIVAITLILGGGVGVAAIFIATGIEPPRKESGELPPLVESIVIQPENVTERFIGYATANAARSAKLAAEISATVVERINNIRAGASVEKDQPLIQLDDREYRLAHKRAKALATAEQAALDEITVERSKLEQLINSAEAELRVTEAERSRVARLFEQEQAAKKEFDFAHLAHQTTRRTLLGFQRELAKLTPRSARVVASIVSFQASAAIALLNVERCTIRAPFAGMIEAIYVDSGDRVRPGTVMVSVVDTNRIEIPLQLPAASYAEIRVGSSCNLTSESLPQAPWRGTIERVAPVIDTQTRTYATYVIVDNRKQKQPLVPGTFVTATIDGATLRDRLLVPRRAIRNGRVFVLRDGHAELRLVEMEHTILDRAIVTGAVRAGDRIILSHLDMLIDGSSVRGEAGTTATVSRSGSTTSSTNGSAP